MYLYAYIRIYSLWTGLVRSTASEYSVSRGNAIFGLKTYFHVCVALVVPPGFFSMSFWTEWK